MTPEHTNEQRDAAISIVPRLLQQRRQRIADELAQMQFDIDHWNRTHPFEEPLTLDADLTADVEALREKNEGKE